MYLPGISGHVVQRGYDRRNPCFFEQEFFFFLGCLKDSCARYDIAIHAYVLMITYIHLFM